MCEVPSEREQTDRPFYSLSADGAYHIIGRNTNPGLQEPGLNERNRTMPRIAPITKDKAPQASQPMLEGIEKKLGRVPNLLGTLAVAPAGLAT